MKKIILITAFLSTFTCFAQSDEIYGISRNSNPNVTYLAKVNTANGVIQDISDTSHAPFIANFSFTVDPVAGIYYYTDGDTFIGVDMNTGALVQQNPVTTSQLPIFQNYIYNEITQEIVGLERGGFNEGFYLSKIDPTTGIVTPISTSPLSGSFVAAGAAIDLRNQWFHVFSEGKILSIDIETGSIVHEPVVDTSAFENFNNLFYNPVDRGLYVLGRNNDPQELFLTQIDPITGVVTTISPSSLGESLALEGSALNPATGIYYFKRPFPINIVGVDINTGEEVSATPFDFTTSNGGFFGHFYFGGETARFLSNDDFFDDTNLNIHPNPTENILQVSGNSISKLSIYSITGQLVESRDYSNVSSITLDIGKYNNGVYLLEVFNDKQQVSISKIIKR